MKAFLETVDSSISTLKEQSANGFKLSNRIAFCFLLHDVICSRLHEQLAAHFEEASKVTRDSLDPSSASPRETHPARLSLLLDPAAARQLAPTTAATAAVRRARPLRLVGPGEEAELESEVTCICATISRCALTAAKHTR